MADIAKIYRVHLRTVRRWAAADNWRTMGARPKLYSLDDAQKSYERRRDHGRQKRTAKPDHTRLASVLDSA